jgi:hypothetical protein
MVKKPYLTAADAAITGLFCTLWIALNVTLGPLSFSLTGLPILHDFAVFFALLLVTWMTGRFGTSSMTGIIGAPLSMLVSGIPVMIGFAPSAVIFDLVMIANHHKIRISWYSLTVAAIATVISAYIAGLLIGLIFLGYGLLFAATFWAGLNATGGIMTVAITFPLIVALEKADVRKIKGD